MTGPAAADYRSTLFEDLNVGEVRHSAFDSATEAEMIAFSKAFDNQYYHVDPEAAKRSPFGGLIASGAHTFAFWNKLHLTVHNDIAWICGIEFEHFRFVKAWRPDMKVRSKSTLIEKRESRSDPTRGVVKHRLELLDEQGDTVLEFDCVALVARRT